MSKKKPDPAQALAEQMLRALEAQRSIGGEAYPPTLQHLGEMCDGAPSLDLIVKAARKKSFTSRASVEALGKVPSLDEPVYFKEDLPASEERLARRMLPVLEAQRRLGEGSYPTTLRRLAELSGFKGKEKDFCKAAETAPMAGRTTALARKGKALAVDAPVVLNEDIREGLEPILPALLRFVLSPVASTIKKKRVETTAFSPADAAKRIIPELRSRLEQALAEGVEREALPRGVGWVIIKGNPLLFLTENLQPEALSARPAEDLRVSPTHQYHPLIPTPHGGDPFHPRDFGEAFRAAFEIFDRRNGSTNFVKLADLRQALEEFSREEFDAGLRQLRLDGVFSLDSHEGLYGTLSNEEREAGVREAGSLLVYASRR